MNYLSVEYLIIYAFLGITMLVGVGGLRMSTVSGSFQNYVNANKRLGVGTLTLTLLATHIGGGLMFSFTSNAYHGGLSMVVQYALYGVLGTFLITLYCVAPKIVYFKNCTTMGDLMHLFYGKNARIITGMAAFYYCSCVCAYQFNWIRYILVELNMDPTWGLAVAAALLAFYTVRGGMRAVAVTDILHFAVAFAIIPLLAHLMLYKAGGLRAVLSSLSPEQLRLFSGESHVTYSDAAKGTSLIIASILVPLFPSFTLSFPFIQRLLMAKHQGQSLGMYRAGVAMFVPFIFVLGLIGLAGAALYPNLDASLHILPYAASQLPLVAKGMVYMAILGIIISTADSFLHTAGVSFVQDTLKPLADSRGIRINELKAVQYSTFLIALFSFLMCTTIKNVLNFYAYGVEFVGMALTFPLVAGVMGLKTERKTFFICLATTTVLFIASNVFLQSKDMPFVIGILTSIISYLIAHYHINRGFVTINRSAYGQTTAVWHPSWQDAGTTLTSFIPTPQKVVSYFQQKIAENSANTTTLALFVAVSYMVPLFMHSIGHPDSYNWLLVLRMGGALLCVGLLLQSQWSDTVLRYFSTYYHLTLLYCFPFMTSFLFFLEGGSIEWVMNAMLSVTLLIMLLDYITAIGLSIVGIALAMGLYKLGIGPLDFSMDRDTAYMLAYGVGFSIAIGVLFQRIRERLLRQANRRLVHQEAALEAHFPEVIAEKEKYTRDLQQIGIKSLLHTARKLHTIQYKTVAAQQGQQNLFASLTQRQKALMNSFMQREISQDAFFAEQQELQAKFDALAQQPSVPQSELPATDGNQAPQTELQTLAQHHLSPQAELNSLAQQQQDLQADLLPLFLQLQDLDTRGKDHLTLQVKKDLPLDQFLLSLQDKLLPRGIDVPVLTERKTKQQKITVDADQLATLLIKGIAALQWLIKDQDQYLLLGIEDTQLSYPLPDVAEGYMKQVPALRITLTATEELPPLDASYRPDLTNFIPTVHQTFQAMEEQADERLIKAHYGYTEVSEDTLIYVIPVDVYEVRPQDMDKPELALGALPERSNDHFKHETADAQAQEQAFLKEVETKSKADLGMVKLALNLIKWYHGHKKRHTEEPFYLHPLSVAQIVMDYDQDEATIVGALLHDTVEDTPMLMGHIEALFGKDTAGVVDLVTHLQSIPGSMYKIRLSAEENLKMLGTTLNRRGLYVKIADRMHNMRTINGHPKVSKRKLVAQETMDFFVPLAKKLGLTEAAAEFEKMCAEVFEQKG